MCPSHHHSVRIGEVLITDGLSPNEILSNGTTKEQQAVQQYNSNNSNSANVNTKNQCECNNSNDSNKKLLYHKFNDNDEIDDDNINVLPSQGTCDSLNSIVLEEGVQKKRHGDDNTSISMSHSPSVSVSVSSSTINSCSGCGRLPTTTSPSPSDQEFNLDASIKRSMYRTKDSYSSTNNSSSNNSFNSTKSSVSAVVNNNVDDSLTIISNNRDASIKLDELSQRSYSISTSDNGVLDDDLEVENPTNNPEVAHVVEHEICDERRSKSSLAKRRRRAGNHNERSDSRRYARSSSSSSSSSSGNTLHSTHSHKSDTHREVHPCSDDRSHLGGSQIPLYNECNCSHYHSNHQKDHSDTPESALIPRPQTSGCQCSYYSATCSTKPSSCSCCSTCHCSDNRCCGCGCDKSIHHKIHPDSECSASSVDFGDDDDVDDEGPKQSLSHNTSSSSTSIASSAPLSVASNLSSISSIHSSSRPQNETHLSNDSKYKHKNHIKTIL